jgi:HEAT repeat protein
LAESLLKIAFDPTQAMTNRWKALHLGASLKGAAAKVDLDKALKSNEWFMRNAALVGIEKLYPKEAQKAARGLLQDKALVVRSAAVEVIRRNLDDEARDLFWDELEKSYNFRNKQSLWVRAQIVEALAQAPEKREMPIFAKLLRDKDTRLHYFSILALEKISNKKLGTTKSTLAQKRDLWLKVKL